MNKGVLATGFAVLIVAAVQVGCTCAPCQDVQKNKEIVLESLEAVRNLEFDKLDEYYAADFVRHCQATPGAPEMTSLQEFKDWLQRDLVTFPAPEYTVTHLVAANDLVSFWATYSAVQEGPMGDFPATGKRMSVDFAGTHRIKDGKIVETWVTWDNMAGLMQLGLWPPENAEEAATDEE